MSTCADGVARRGDPLIGDAIESDRDLGLRCNVGGDGGSRAGCRQTCGQRFPGAKEVRREHNRVGRHGVRFRSRFATLENLAGRRRAVEAGVQFVRFTRHDGIDRQLDRVPDVVITHLEPSDHEVQRPGHAACRTEGPPIIRLRDRDALGSNRPCLDENVERRLAGSRRRL